MTKTEIKKIAAAYIRTMRARLEHADTPDERTALVADINTFLHGPGYGVLSDPQRRTLHKLMERALP